MDAIKIFAQATPVSKTKVPEPGEVLAVLDVRGVGEILGQGMLLPAKP
jgi:hypothetical protein